MENFLFDIGGLIGLFLGSSILSVLELLVDILRTIRNYIRNTLRLRRERKMERRAHVRRMELATRFITTINTQGFEIDELSVEDLED